MGMTSTSSIGTTLGKILLFPIALTVFLIAFPLWTLLTLTGIGPLYHHLRTKSENQWFQQHVRNSSEYSYFLSPRGYRLAYRLLVADTSSSNYKKYPIVIPGGLAATMLTTNKMQDLLHEQGFTVLAYDRLGVGLSDPNSDGTVPSVEDVLDDMHHLMMEAMGPDMKWILLGPSMGSIVAQSYLVRYPEQCIGFLNLDGFPHPFAARRDKFQNYGKVYHFVSNIHFTGITRALTCFAGGFCERFSTETTSVKAIVCQMNQKQFVANIPIEMMLMMDFAQDVAHAWGSLNILSLSEDELNLLLALPPTNNGEMNESKTAWISLPCSSAEIGDVWADLKGSEEVQKKLELLREKRRNESALGETFEKLVVRILGARKYMESEFDTDMIKWNGAEHALHHYMAGNGKRYAFPQLDHTKMFLLYPEIVQVAVDLYKDLDEGAK